MIPNHLVHPMPHGKSRVQAWPTKVKIPVLQPYILACEFNARKFSYFKRWRRTFIKDLQFNCKQLDLACGMITIFFTGQALSNLTSNSNDKFPAKFLCQFEHWEVGGICFKHNLGDAIAVAEIDKDLIFIATIGVNPTVKGNLMIFVGDTNFAAVVGSTPVVIQSWIAHGNTL